MFAEEYHLQLLQGKNMYHNWQLPQTLVEMGRKIINIYLVLTQREKKTPTFLDTSLLHSTKGELQGVLLKQMTGQN